MSDFEIRDQNGRVIGAGTGDRAWVEKTLADMKDRGVVADNAKVRPALRIVEGLADALEIANCEHAVLLPTLRRGEAWWYFHACEGSFSRHPHGNDGGEK